MKILILSSNTFKINNEYAKLNNYDIKDYNNIIEILNYFNEYDYILFLKKNVFIYVESPKLENIINKFLNKNIILSGSDDLYGNKIGYLDTDIRLNFILLKTSKYNSEIFNKIFNNDLDNLILLQELYKNNFNNLQNNLEIIPYNILLNNNIEDNKNFYNKEYNLLNKPYGINLNCLDNLSIEYTNNNYYDNYISNYSTYYVISIVDNVNKEYEKKIIDKGFFPLIIKNLVKDYYKKIKIYYNYIKNLTIDNLIILDDISKIDSVKIINKNFKKLPGKLNYIGNKNNLLKKLFELNENKLLVSVIIPTFNRFKFLLNAINSIKQQTYKNLEIIVVNDKSTEKEYYDYNWEENNIKIIHLEENSKKKFGFACAGGYQRNFGLDMSNGELIAFCDDDDSWFPAKIEIQIKEMLNNNCMISGTDALVGNGMYDINKKYKKYNKEYAYKFILDKYEKTNFMKNGFPNIWTYNFLKINNCMLLSSAILDCELINEVGKFKITNKGDEDYDYWLRCLKNTNLLYINRALIYYDIGHGYGQNYK